MNTQLRLAHPLLTALLIAAILCPTVGCSESDEPSEVGAYDDEGPSLLPAGGKADGLDIPAYAPLPAWADLDMAFEVLFAPDDPVNTVEIALIDQVRDARNADPGQYAEGENPFRIRYAVYNLRNPPIVQRLIDAANEGVDVQILIEDHQLDPAKTWNVADEQLIEAGFEFVPRHTELAGDAFVTADLIGIRESGLMHMKARIYETPDSRAVLSGSLNPGDNAMLNEETLHLVRDPVLIDRYAAAYDVVLRNGSFDNVWDADRDINVMFTPAGSGPRAVEKVFEWVSAEEEQILLMVFSMRDIRAPGYGDSLVELLSAKAQAGVPVYVITDRKQSDGVDSDGTRRYYNDNTEDRLRAGGVHVYEAINTAGPFNAMHHKAAILGRTDIKVITDAANWTKAGLGSGNTRAKNIESQLFIDDERIGRRYMLQWFKVLQRYAHQSEGEPGYDEVRATLEGLDDWPTQTVSFAVTAETEWGENVWVRGDQEPLGIWGESHDGVRCNTNSQSYPLWSCADVALPLGSAFEWKAVASGNGNTRWENGDNRAGEAVPTVLWDGQTVVQTGQWR